jgi:hypothetical protein
LSELGGDGFGERYGYAEAGAEGRGVDGVAGAGEVVGGDFAGVSD